MLLDYCANFPEAEEKTTKCRGKVQLSAYIQSEGHRQAKKKRRATAKMDYEAFVTAMANQRRWDQTKADSKWRELDTLENFVDNAGPAPHTKRLRIPPELLCNDMSESEEEHFEERKLQTRGQAVKNATEELKAQLKAEMSRGFATVLAGPDGKSMRQALPNSAVTLTQGDKKQTTGISLLMAAQAGIEGSGSGNDAANSSQGAVAASPTHADGQQADLTTNPSPAKTPVKDVFDVRSKQTSFMRAANGTLAGLHKKVTEQVHKVVGVVSAYHEQMGSTHGDEDDDEYIIAAERLQLAMLWLNSQPAEAKDPKTGEVLLCLLFFEGPKP